MIAPTTPNSIIRQIVNDIASTLSDHEFFRTVPQIPVISEESKTVSQEIAKASEQAKGCFVLIGFTGAEADLESPGPYLTTCNFTATVVEYPGFWRSKPGKTPTCTEIAEAVSRILHFTEPVDDDGNKLCNGVISFRGMEQSSDDSALIQTINLQLPLVLSTDDPTR
jgi:hypothetical protein